ncbi:MAG: baseplate J/gp47 family protein [Polyangiaceae bacterium]
MPSLADVLTPPTKEQLRSALLNQLAGLGWSKQTGYGYGTVDALSGVPVNDYDVVVKIVAGGVLGVATFQLSTDGGITFGATTATPALGAYVIPGVGVTLTFTNGAPTPTGFVVGDSYRLELRVRGFPVTAWQPLSTPLSMVENDAEALEDLYALIEQIAAGGFILEAAKRGFDAWVDLHGTQFYGLARRQGVGTLGVVTLYDTAGQGPFVRAAGDTTVQTSFGLRFVNVAGYTLPLGGSVQVAVQAEAVGSKYNVANNAINQLVTALPGVAALNVDPGTGSWITTVGSDVETSIDYANRCINRWPSLGIGVPTGNYDRWAKEAVPGVTKTTSRVSPTLAGHVELFLASNAGPVSGGDVTIASDYVQVRAPLGITVDVASSTGAPVVISGNVFVKLNLLAQAQAEVNANLQALIAELPISGLLYRAAVIEAVMTPAGVVNYVPILPAGDVQLSFAQVGTLTNSLTFTGI